MKKILLSFLMACLVIPAIAQFNLTLRSNVTYPSGLNDIWGWVDEDTGIEYALVGRRDGVSIVSLEDLDNAVEVQFIPGPNSTWRDLKTYGDFAYVTNETSNGVLVIDLSQLPDAAPSFDWTPVTPAGTISSCHNLYIDERGICYLAGCNVNGGGLIYVDVATNPGQPEIIGLNEAIYSHDVFVRDGIIYDSQINTGNLSIYDHTNLDETVLISRQRTPFSFTHNAWISDDNQTVYTTDERNNASVAAYDITDPSDPVLIDEYRPLSTLGLGVLPHNVHVLDDYLMISHYTQGGIIVDASRPQNLVEVGHYPTWGGAPGGTNGAWGLYPFLPSGTILVTDISNGLFVLSPNLVRAAWLEGTVTEVGTGNTIDDVSVSIDAPNQVVQETTNGVGEYATGIATPGTFSVTFSKPGFGPVTVPATFQNGEVTVLNVELESLPRVVITGNVIDGDTNEPIEDAVVSFQNSEFTFEVLTDENGTFSISAFESEYVIFVGKWGFRTQTATAVLDGSVPLNYELFFAYADDFAIDLGWEATSDGIATTGFWERGLPVGTAFGNRQSNIGADLADDLGDACYVTGNAGGGAGNDDVDDGLVILTSPSCLLYTSPSPRD